MLQKYSGEAIERPGGYMIKKPSLIRKIEFRHLGVTIFLESNDLGSMDTMKVLLLLWGGGHIWIVI